MPIRVVIADDQALLRSTFRLLLESTPDIEVVGEAGTGDEAVRLARSERADVVLMDIRMPGMDGIEASRRIIADEAMAGVRILVLTTFEEEDLVLEALRAGVSGYLGKGVQSQALLEAIRTVAAGESLLSHAATTALIGRLLDQPAPDPRQHERLAVLTPRECEVTRLVARGLSNDEIGDALFISRTTAKTHVNRAMLKTGSRDRAQLVILAYEAGLVRAGETAR